MSVCVPISLPYGTTWFPLKGFSWNLIWAFLENLSRKFKFLYNLTRVTYTLYEDQSIFLSYLAQLLSEWKVFRTKFVEKIKTHVLCPETFFSKIMLLWDNVKNNCTDGQTTRDNTIRCMRTACWVYKHNQNMSCLLLFHCHNSRTSTPKCYVIVYCLSCVLQFQLLYKKLSQHY
jgi:hypothetical protein